MMVPLSLALLFLPLLSPSVLGSDLVVVVPGTHDRHRRGVSEGGVEESLVVTTHIEERYAITLCQNTVVNQEEEAQEVEFVTILPEEAFISRFAIESGEELYHANVKEKEEAELIYKEAVSTGKTAGSIFIIFSFPKAAL